MKPRVAIVVQRYGLEVNGGAEWAARWTAEHLQEVADVTVLTTCAQDYTTWENVYPPGETELNGVPVHRFRVDAPRRWPGSQQETGRFLLQAHTLDEEIAWIRQQGPFSSDLLRYVRRTAVTYDLFFCFTYLYATTFFTLPLVADKGVLVPAAHDEPFLYLDVYRALFQLPRYLLFLTKPEQELVTAVTGADHIPAQVVGLGIEPPPTAPDLARFRQQTGLRQPFLLYGGRISEAKNVPEMLDFFTAYKKTHPGPLKLALMGRPHMSLPEHPDIIPLGFLSEQEKWDALHAAELVLMPSKFESLSIIILESWLVGTPVMVNGRCAVTRHQVVRSQGGLYYDSFVEFAAVLDLFLSQPDLREKMGENGRRFVQNEYQWSVIRSRYLDILNQLLPWHP